MIGIKQLAEMFLIFSGLWFLAFLMPILIIDQREFKTLKKQYHYIAIVILCIGSIMLMWIGFTGL